ncbi:hypothetical protein NL351_27440, partial [Klebsiella pneumoniae]|nr:hypothetical protein [Klebsiella pneumoniae]
IRWSQLGTAAKPLGKSFRLTTSIPTKARFEDSEGDGDVNMVFVPNNEASIELPTAGQQDERSQQQGKEVCRWAPYGQHGFMTSHLSLLRTGRMAV